MILNWKSFLWVEGEGFKVQPDLLVPQGLRESLVVLVRKALQGLRVHPAQWVQRVLKGR